MAAFCLCCGFDAVHSTRGSCDRKMPPTDPSARRLVWRKARSSTAHGACVEVADAGPVVAVRDSKNPESAILTLAAAEWQSFLDRAKRGEFDTLA
jgi:hypothetical protein